MTSFWILIVLVLIISLLLIWVPHFRQQKLNQVEEAGVRNNTNLELFNERLSHLEKELAHNKIEQSEFTTLKTELEISLLQDMKQGEDESLSTQAKPKNIAIPSLMSLIMIIVALYAYLHLGAYQEMPLIQAQQAGITSNPHAGMSKETLIKQEVIMFESQTEQDPTNAQAWFNLGHAYISAHRYNDAANAFDKAMVIVGPQAEILGPKATALYYKSNQQMTPQVQQIIDKALQLDPRDPSTLLLVGINHFVNHQYLNAIKAWETILSSGRNDIDRQAITNAIESAKMRLAAESKPIPETKQDLQHHNATITLNVSIAPKLQQKVSDSDILFVYARATNGERMPIAATKISAKALPATVILDNSTHMGGALSLTNTKNVQVIAVLSKHGSVRPQAGDLRGELALVPVGDTATLVLDTVVQ